MQTIVTLLAIVGTLSLLFAGLTALVGLLDRPNQIVRVAPKAGLMSEKWQ